MAEPLTEIFRVSLSEDIVLQDWRWLSLLYFERSQGRIRSTVDRGVSLTSVVLRRREITERRDFRVNLDLSDRKKTVVSQHKKLWNSVDQL